MNDTAEWLRRRLPELVAEHGVGAQVAVLADGEIHDAAAGVLSTATGERVTVGSLFQIGSITKVWTATLVAQLVGEGLLDLDRPVREVLPEFRLADERVARAVTPRQLLCHLGGFEGDQWFDTGTGDDCVARFVALLADARQLTEPGELFSYCNAGYVVLGRIVEVLRGRPFHVVLRERLVGPLGLTNVATHYDEYPAHRGAEGHLSAGGPPVDTMMPGSDAPAGSAFAMNARSLVRFARMHLETTAYDAMRVQQVKTPDGGGWGLGWTVHHYPNGTIGVGHGGATMGQDAALRVLPEAGVAIAVLTNGGAEAKLQRAVFSHLLGELAGVHLAELPVPPEPPVPVDAAELTGVYRSSALDVHITPAAEGRVRVRYEPKHWICETTMTDRDRGTDYTTLSDDALIAVDEPHTVLRLVRRDDQVRWVHFGRAAVRR
ncbi:serine hydrolase [Streptomyces sp. ID05-26A]|nr:serine hydrolase [Streptomyces sp. ID05-26A]